MDISIKCGDGTIIAGYNFDGEYWIVYCCGGHVTHTLLAVGDNT